MRSSWTFHDPPNTAVITTRRIVYESRPVLSVIHEEDGWQFLDGGYVTMADAVVIGLGNMLSKAPDLMLLADLPEGWKAWRETPQSPWQRSAL